MSDTSNWVLDALRRAKPTPPVSVEDPWLHAALTDQRRVRLGPREQAALERVAAETGRSPAELLADYGRLVRWTARWLLILTGLDLELAEHTLATVEDGLAADGLSYVLESNRTEARRRRRELPLENAPLLAVTPPPFEWHLMYASAPPAERRFLDEWRKDPDAGVADAMRRLGKSPQTGYEYVRRIRERAAGGV